jgi:glucose-1-phosphate cytidylyltransferase
MKVFILAGGFGTRISEETADKPKPMVLVNGKPILWHVMSIYASQGFSDFVIGCGYKKEVIFNYIENEFQENWDVTPIDTGEATLTGGRIGRYLDLYPNERFMLTYGDGVGNIDVNKLLARHKEMKTLVTLTAVRPPSRFGSVISENGIVTHFGEKNQADAGWINGGFMVIEPKIREWISSDEQAFEADILPELVKNKYVSTYLHDGFWQPMDTLREKNDLDELAKLSMPPWLLI